MSKKTVPAKLKGKKSFTIKNDTVKRISKKLRKRKLVLTYLLVMIEVLDKLNINIIKRGRSMSRWWFQVSKYERNIIKIPRI